MSSSHPSINNNSNNNNNNMELPKKKKQPKVKLSEMAMGMVYEDDVEGFKKAWPTTKGLPKDILHIFAKECAIDLIAFLLSKDSGYDCPSANLKAGTGTTPLHILAARTAQEMLILNGSKQLNDKAPNHNYYDPNYNRHHIFNEEKKQYEYNGFIGHRGIKILLNHGADASIVDNSKPGDYDLTQKMTPYDVYVWRGGNPYKEDWIQSSFPLLEVSEKMTELVHKKHMLEKEECGSREDQIKKAEKFIASREFQQMLTEVVPNLALSPPPALEAALNNMKQSIIKMYLKKWDELHSGKHEETRAKEIAENARTRAMLEEKAVVLKLLLDAENAGRKKKKLPKRNIDNLTNNNTSTMLRESQERLSRLFEETEAKLLAKKSIKVKEENGNIDGASSSIRITNSANNNNNSKKKGIKREWCGSSSSFSHSSSSDSNSSKRMKKESVWREAAEAGDLNIMIAAKKNGITFSGNDRNGGPWYHYSAYTVAAKNGHLHILKWLKQNCHEPRMDRSGRVYMVDNCIYEEAAKGGHLNILKWAKEEGYHMPIRGLDVSAAAGGYLEILKWLHSYNYRFSYLDSKSMAAGFSQTSIFKTTDPWIHPEAFNWLEKQEPKLKLTDVHDGLTVDMLRKHLRCRRLKHQGLKKDLIDRLKADVIRQQ